MFYLRPEHTKALWIENLDGGDVVCQGGVDVRCGGRAGC